MEKISGFAVILIISFWTQNLFAQNTTPPDMAIPPEFSQPAVPAPAPASSDQPQTTPAPIELNAPTTYQENPIKSAQLPDDFELIGIKPYFKNKPRLGLLTATLSSSENETLATVSGEFGDCKNCIRGASVKGKIGVRLFGKTAGELTVSRKQSSSIKINECPANDTRFVNNTYTCEFSHKDVKMKLTLKLDP